MPVTLSHWPGQRSDLKVSPESRTHNAGAEVRSRASRSPTAGPSGLWQGGGRAGAPVICVGTVQA